MVVSVGIADEYWGIINPAVSGEFDSQKPAWLGKPEIVKSPFSKKAARIGIAKHVASEVRRDR